MDTSQLCPDAPSLPEVALAVPAVIAVEKVLRRTRGWSMIWGFVITHNVWAAGRGHEMLSQAAQRQSRAHPVLVPVLAFGLYAHLMGWLGPYDPISKLGDLVEKFRGLRRG